MLALRAFHISKQPYKSTNSETKRKRYEYLRFLKLIIYRYLEKAKKSYKSWSCFLWKSYIVKPSLGPQKSLVRVCAHRGTETLLCAAMAAPSMIIEFLELIWEIKQSTLKSCTGSQIDSWIFQPRNTEPCNDDCVDPSPVFQKCISMRMLLFKKWGSQGLEPDAVPNSDNYKSADSCQGVNRQLFWSIVC